MENKEFKSVFLPRKAMYIMIEKSTLFRLPHEKDEPAKYFWVASKLIHKIGKDFVLNYGDNFTFTLFEQVKNEQGLYEKTHEESVNGDFIKGVFAKESKEIEEAYLKWKKQTEDKKEVKNEKIENEQQHQQEYLEDFVHSFSNNEEETEHQSYVL